MKVPDLRSYSDWLHASSEKAKADSHSPDFAIRKSADVRVDTLAAGIALLTDYLQTPKNVLMFSASQMKKPISTNESNSGILRSRSSGRNITVVLA